MDKQSFEIIVDSRQGGMRLDVFIAKAREEISRSRIQKLIDQKQAMVNGEPARANYKVKAGDRIRLEIPATVPLQVQAERIPLNIVFEDDAMLVVDKPAGMVVHPAPGNFSGTLVNAVLNHCNDLSGIGGVERPGIVHRLDKDTSGLVIVAKTEAAHRDLSRQFKNRTIEKVYLALVCGRVKNDRGVIDSPIARHKTHRKKMASGVEGGREAQTRYEVVSRHDTFSLLRLHPKTGRTHQLRVHLASIHHPILGDKLYGGREGKKFKAIPRQALHAHILELTHPVSHQTMRFESPLPEDMANYLDGLTDPASPQLPHAG